MDLFGTVDKKLVHFFLGRVVDVVGVTRPVVVDKKISVRHFHNAGIYKGKRFTIFNTN